MSTLLYKLLSVKFGTTFYVSIAAMMMLSFAGCGAGKDTVRGEKEVIPVAEAPEWVGNRPHSAGNYIGVGTCSKVTQPLDYQTIAKKNALNDLASEISVRVQGETFLNTLEVNKNFSEEFISTISTTTDEKIEDYEVAGIWENDKEYWVYYRLNKGQYQQKKQQKKNQALSAAHDYYTKGLTAESEANIPAAFDLYMHGLFAMKEYWSEVNEFMTDSGKVFLDNELYSSLQRISDGMVMNLTTQKVILSSANRYNQDVEVQLTYGGKPVRGITMMAQYQKDTYMKPRPNITGNNGEVFVNVSDVSGNEKSNNLSLSINLDPLICSDLDKTIQAGLIKGLRTAKKTVPIEFLSPSFFIKSTESNFGTPAQAAVLASAMSTELVKNGMRISGIQSESDYIVEILSNTTEGGSSQGFVVAFLEMTVIVRKPVNDEVVYRETLSAIKGLQMNKDAAGMDAYKKGKEKIQQQVLKSVMDAIM